MMYNAVAVEYSVKETIEKKKTRGYRKKNKNNESSIKYTRPSTAGGVRSQGSSDPFTSTATANNNNNNINNNNGGGTGLPGGVLPRPSNSNRPKSPGVQANNSNNNNNNGNSRPSTAGSGRRKSHDNHVNSTIYPHQHDWVNPWGIPDLDKLHRDKTMALAGHRSKYDHDDSRRDSNPNLVHGESRLAQKHDKSVNTRERYYPNTVGTIVNNELPFYPFLKEQTRGVVVTEKWNRMTISEDDPLRARPENREDKKKDRQSFHHTFDQQYPKCADEVCVTHHLSEYPSLASKF